MLSHPDQLRLLPLLALVHQRAEQPQHAVVFGADLQVLTQADDERDIVFIEEFQPSCTDELPVGEQGVNRGYLEQAQVATHQFNALRR